MRDDVHVYQLQQCSGDVGSRYLQLCCYLTGRSVLVSGADVRGVERALPCSACVQVVR
jgi:hypothetical protein